MNNLKVNKVRVLENIFFGFVIVFIIIQALIKQDYWVALVNAICGITYTFFSGKGYPICYLFGVVGSAFYSYLAFQNALWGNLLLYAGYYIPMQMLGYFKWNKNLKAGKSEIIKVSLSSREQLLIYGFLIVLVFITFAVLCYFKDAHPILDSITTILSIGGMYLTVRRAIQQWILWAIVNILSLIMWINVLISGVNVRSTVVMWAVYSILAIYFYIIWKKEIKLQNLEEENARS